jgi:hypothetical protein
MGLDEDCLFDKAWKESGDNLFQYTISKLRLQRKEIKENLHLGQKHIHSLTN